VAPDERLRRELERAGRPADPTGIYEDLIRRRERRRIRRRAGVAGLAVLVVAGSAVAVMALSRVFGTGVEPAASVPPSTPTLPDTPAATPTASASVASAGEDIGLGFPVCNVTSVGGEFAPGSRGTAYVAPGLGDAGGGPEEPGGFQVVAVDATGDGLADASYGPLECETLPCRAFGAPDVNGDGIDELLIENVAFTIKGLKLFVMTDGSVAPAVVAPPGSTAFGYEGFEAGAEPQLWLGGDAGNWDAIRCEPFDGGRAFVSTTSFQPVDAPGDREVTETWFVLDGLDLLVVDVQEYSAPEDGGTPPYMQTDGCGVRFPYP
jgi:hypothetical protein